MAASRPVSARRENRDTSWLSTGLTAAPRTASRKPRKVVPMSAASSRAQTDFTPAPSIALPVSETDQIVAMASDDMDGDFEGRASNSSEFSAAARPVLFADGFE